ncbi:MAG: GNAT family N-acetyltransferase [Firmicutes bacterium]|nr:GNAT family N-acetyltransferase [Bacillota bacterium]
MLNIRAANAAEFPAVRAFYHRLIDQAADYGYPLGWEKDVYPSPDQLRRALSRRQLYLGEEAGEILTALILDRECNEGYAGAPWAVAAGPEQVSVIHALGVLPRTQGRGLGREMVRAAVAQARACGSRALRLDVLAGNLPAERLYLSQGFRRISTVRMYYPDTGWTEFDLYELPLIEE